MKGSREIVWQLEGIAQERSGKRLEVLKSGPRWEDGRGGGYKMSNRILEFLNPHCQICSYKFLFLHSCPIFDLRC